MLERVKLILQRILLSYANIRYWSFYDVYFPKLYVGQGQFPNSDFMEFYACYQISDPSLSIYGQSCEKNLINLFQMNVLLRY